MHAVSIEAGGIVPLPRVGGALSHAAGSIRNLPRHCQTEVCQGVHDFKVKRVPVWRPSNPRIFHCGDSNGGR